MANTKFLDMGAKAQLRDGLLKGCAGDVENTFNELDRLENIIRNYEAVMNNFVTDINAFDKK